MRVKDHTEIPFVRELMKGKSDEDICAAEENFQRYLLLVKRITERLEQQETDGICHVEDHREGRDETNCELCGQDS